MTTALYHQAGLPAKKLDVLRTHADGTVDLGLDGVLLVSACPVAEVAAPGVATSAEDRPAPPATTPAKKKA